MDEKMSKQMKVRSEKYLNELLATHGPSGYEQSVQQVFRAHMLELTKDVRTDLYGNTIAAISTGLTPRVLLAAHCDECGLVIRHVSEEGFLYVATVGSLDNLMLSGRRVLIHTNGGIVPGVIGRKSIHLLTQEERSKIPKPHEVWVDVGSSNRDEAMTLVRIGDPITFDVDPIQLQNRQISSRALDDRGGLYIISEALRYLCERKPACALYVVSTVQEEIGMRGSRMSTFHLDPAVGLAVDATQATDYPDVDQRQVGDIRLGLGPVLARGPNIHPMVFELLVSCAERARIPYQIRVEPEASGTDANPIQINRSGVATGIVSFPVRYMHTPCEIAHLDDLENAARLVEEFVFSVGIAPEIKWSR